MVDLRQVLGAVVVGLLFVAGGLLLVAYPQRGHDVLRGWKYENSELSPQGRRSMQLRGAVISAVGLLLVIVVAQ